MYPYQRHLGQATKRHAPLSMTLSNLGDARSRTPTPVSWRTSRCRSTFAQIEIITLADVQKLLLGTTNIEEWDRNYPGFHLYMRAAEKNNWRNT